MRHGLAAIAAAGVLGVSVIATSLPAAAQSLEKRGRALAEARCARCHAVGAKGASPVAPAPPFRTLPERYPVESLAEALAEGIVVGHPLMPEFKFDPPDIDALLAHIQSLAPKR
jgi:mono/diheme cytochrome c family protein